MNIDDRIDQLYEAAERLEEAIELLDDALAGTDVYNQAKAYIIPHLRSWHSNPGFGNSGIIQYAEELEDERDYMDTMR